MMHDYPLPLKHIEDDTYLFLSGSFSSLIMLIHPRAFLLANIMWQKNEIERNLIFLLSKTLARALIPVLIINTPISGKLNT